MDFEHIKTETDGHLLVITINRPDVMNAVSPKTNFELEQAFDAFEADDDLWVAIITGAGDKAFCSGGDISDMVDAKDDGDYAIPKSGYGGLTSRTGCYKPIIAAVNGFAFGGGFEIALAADLIVAAETANFGLPEPKIGTAAIAGGMHRLVRQIGLKQAMKILLTAEPVTAMQALELGLVNEVVEPDKVMEAARNLAGKILLCAPISIRATKQCAIEGLNLGSPEAAQKAQEEGDFELIDTMMHSSDIGEGLKAFMEKRKPVWQNQ